MPRRVWATTIRWMEVRLLTEELPPGDPFIVLRIVTVAVIELCDGQCGARSRNGRRDKGELFCHGECAGVPHLLR